MLESGRTVADYQIVKPLAENPIFATYQVVGPGREEGKLLLLNAEQLVDRKSRQAFIAQAKLLCGQSFPGISSLIAADSNDEHSYCLYPLVSGTPLSDWLDNPFPLRSSLELIKTLALQLSPAHASGLWHGAISPATVYLDDQGVYLDQFALASLVPLDFQSGIDPRYGSPELVRGEPLSPASDLYSLGILLYRLLTGGEPFVAEEPFATAMMHLQSRIPSLPDELAILQPLIDGLLCGSSTDRWTADHLVVELDQLLLRPELDGLQPVRSVQPESEVEAAEEDDSPIEKLTESSEMSARIEQRLQERLQERAEALQQSVNLTPDNKRASSARISAIGRQSYQKTQAMNQQAYRRTGGMGKFILLAALGIAVGAAIYLYLFQPQAVPQQADSESSPQLLNGLEVGSQQLQQGDVAGAEQTFSRLLEAYPMAPQPYNNLAALAASQGDLEQARMLLERAMATDTAYATVYRNLGMVYAEMARDSYGRALQLEHGHQAVELQVFGARQLLAMNTAEPADVEPAVAGETGVANESPATEEVAVSAAEAEPVEPIVPPAETVVAVSEPVLLEAIDEVPVEQVNSLPEPEDAEQFMRRWAAAWSRQDVAAYLEFYAEEFVPSAGIGREVWASQRQDRLTRPQQILVELSDFVLLEQSGDKLQLELTQSYQSDRYRDVTRKRFDLVQVGTGWLITRERSLGRVR